MQSLEELVSGEPQAVARKTKANKKKTFQKIEKQNIVGKNLYLNFTSLLKRGGTNLLMRLRSATPR